MNEKIDFFQKLKARLPHVEKDSLYQRLVDSAQENRLLEEVLENLEEGVILTDRKGMPFFVNRKAEVWLGVRAGKKKSLWEYADDPAMAGFLKEHLGSAEVRVVNDFKLLTPREMQLRIAILPCEQETRKTFAVFLLDITSRTEQEFETALLSRMESLIRLAGGIAHEIGNPLNAITIHLELLKKRLGGISSGKRKEIEDSLTDIQSETKRLDRIIRNFLKATRKPPLRFRLNDLNDTVAEALDFMRPQLDAGKIRIKFSRATDIPPFLMDRERLYYAFMNLLKNALEAMPQGGVLKVSVGQQDRCAVVTIVDSGCGIADEDLPHIFDIYYTTKAEGAGLGLMMVYDSIAEHGGKIDVSSKAGKGTTFKILLPIREPQLQLPDYGGSRGG
ncbi:MAG TPA: ATP-binding protein [Candidatus Omnitrophota bacterium]|nr:ATP-binding protein [Candidatus Omnitrophota bacterium]HPS37150.1 ATP-binding protein [Candidatus Omnitrophota bacterium]